MRLASFGQPELTRNSPCTVLEHYSAGVVTVSLPSGTVRNVPLEEVYQLTGKEKLPLPERLPNLQKLTKQEKEAAREAAAGVLQLKLTALSKLESGDLDAAWHELRFRARVSGDSWPLTQLICLNTQEADFWLSAWSQSPGSPEAQQAVAQAKAELAPLLANPAEAALLFWPVCAGGHWTLLSLKRLASEQGDHKLTVCYNDSLPITHKACLTRASSALTFLLEVLGRDSLANHQVPEPGCSGKQKDATACGFFVLNWLEEGYRWLRGEGVHRLTEDFKAKAADLQRWNNTVAKAVFVPGAKAASMKAAVGAVLAKAASSSAAPTPLPVPAPASPLPLPGPPLNSQEEWGCSRCRGAKTGCLTCNPSKSMKYHAKRF